MFLKWLKKKKSPSPSKDRIDQLAERHYLYKLEKRKTENLASYIETTWVIDEEKRAFVAIGDILTKHLPLYRITDFAKIKQDHHKGLFNTLPEADLNAIGRLCQYQDMVEGFPEEMASGHEGEALFSLFSAARHSRLVSYHLFQLVNRLETELSACLKTGLRQYIYEALVESGLIRVEEQNLPVDALTKRQKEEIAAGENMQEYLEKLSLELAGIMAHELQLAVDLMKQTLVDPDLQKEPIAFEEDVGLPQLHQKVGELQKLAQTLSIPHLKQQLLAELHL